MSLSDDLVGAAAASEKHPPGWEPYTEYTDQVGEAVVKIPTPSSTHRDLLVTAGFDPDRWRISGPVNTRKWMRYDQEWLYYYRFDVVAGESTEAAEVHVEELTDWLRKRRRVAASRTTKPLASSTDAFVYVASDWQIGKSLRGDGSKQTAERVVDTIDQAVVHLRQLRKLGYAMPQGGLIGLGDLGEGTCGFYPAQPYEIDLNRRDQNKLTRELIVYAIDRLAPEFDEFVIASVGGNHGENRTLSGKVLTDAADNDDVAQFEIVREAFTRAGHENYANLHWIIPDDELAIQFELGGVRVGATHGHLFQRGRGATPQQKAMEWWKDQDFGLQELRGAELLFSGHFHHFSVNTYGTRVAIQAGPMDPGSKWWVDTRGADAPAGALSMRLDSSLKLHYDHLRVLEPSI